MTVAMPADMPDPDGLRHPMFARGHTNRFGSYLQWFLRPFSSTYSLRVRLSDVIAGLVDGYNHTLLIDVNGAPLSKHLDAIRSQRDENLSRIEMVHHDQIHELNIDIPFAEQRLREAVERLTALRSEHEALKAIGPDSGRRMGEEVLPDEFVLRRRRREHDRTLQSLSFVIGKATGSRDNRCRELQEMRSRLEALVSRQESETDAVRRTYDIRISVYLKAASKTHPDGASVTTALTRDTNAALTNSNVAFEGKEQ